MLSGFRRFTRTHLLKRALAGRFGEGSVLIQCSSPRSGSTLLSQVLAAIPRTCVLFEPELVNYVPEAEAAELNHQVYIEPGASWPAGEQFFDRVFSGRVINKWTACQMSHSDVRAQRMIIKLVRANRLLPWMCSKYNLAPPVFLIRHPCAVVASQMNYGWLGQHRPIVPAYIEKFPMFKRAIAELERPEEYLAADWVLDQLPALFQPQPNPWTIVTYEELLLHPEPTVSKIAQSWNLEIDMDRAMSRLKRPSTTVSKSGIRGIGGWKNDLSNLQVSMILGTIHKFGIRFYGDEAEADYTLLHSNRLAADIRRVGMVGDHYSTTSSRRAAA
jgi:hypothetical protein